MKKPFYYNNSTLLLIFAIVFASFNALAQPTDGCNSTFTGTGIPVTEHCELRSFNVMANYTNNISNTNASGLCNASSSSSYKDAYWWFEGTGETVTIRYKPIGGNVETGYYDPTMAVLTGSCTNSNPGTVSTCVNAGSNGIMEVITMPTVNGTKYRIRIQNRSNNNSSTMYGQICIMKASPTTANSTCAAYPLAVDSLATPNYFNLNTFNTGAIVIPAPTCGSYTTNKKKAFFNVTMPTTDLTIETERGNGTSTDTDYTNSAMAIYKANGSCPNETYTLLGCYREDTFIRHNISLNTINNYNIMAKALLKNGVHANAGDKLLIVVWSENNNTSHFGISAYTSTKCGNPLGLKNDFCENPAQMYKAPGTTFSASTSGVFTPDQFPNGRTPDWDCSNGQDEIYVHNNSWYQFTAELTIEIFPFSAGCQGIQAVVLEPIYTPDSCCTRTFIQKSNCNSQMSNGSNAGTIKATGLTPGKKYVLMVDGYSGAQCNFSILNWNAKNILLGINLLDFSAEANDTYNTLRWTTKYEKNNDYFTVLRSTDGENWEEVERVEGAGTSNNELSYETYDENIRMGTIYYRLKQTDFDGEFTYSNIIVLNRGSEDTGIINVSPNPTAGEVTINIVSTESEGEIVITTINGQVMHRSMINNKGVHAVNYDMTDLPQGVYLVNYKDASTQSIRQLVKQ